MSKEHVRLIDANELKEKMCFKCNDEYSDEPCEPDDCVFCNAINDAQTIDAVEVIRCRECKYLEKDDGLKYGRMCLKLGNSSLCHDDDFSSYGQRKEGAD